MTERVALMLVSLPAAERLGIRFKGLGVRIVSLYPGLRYDLRNAQLSIAAESYCVGAVFSALVWGLLAALFLGVIAQIRAMPLPAAIFLPFAGFVLMTLAFLVLHLYYPSILSRSVATKIDRGLTFATRDMLIQISSGIPLFSVLSNIADGDYGQVSVEFRKVVNEARSGTSLTEALENMAVRNQSKYIKKTAWQLITSMRAGANLTVALRGIIKLLVDYQMRLNKAYNAELNFIVLVYLLVAAVLPTVGTTVLVIFSVFGILGVTPELFLTIVAGGFVAQCAIIGYIYLRRPRMYE
ncbi:MAG: type II secretion system F family protein [Candidatus Micrarchaeota archaeon]|nr:type II secretion system F family protein [Candidatus Micrarchaeota archaeon]